MARKKREIKPLINYPSRFNELNKENGVLIPIKCCEVCKYYRAVNLIQGICKKSLFYKMVSFNDYCWRYKKRENRGSASL